MVSKQELQLDRSCQLYLPGCTWTPVGLKFNGKLTEEQLDQAGHLIGEVQKRSMWAIGDWYAEKERRGWGDYEDSEERFGLKYQTVANAKWVSQRVEFSVRTENLSWQHHLHVAPLELDEQRKWLGLAELEGWSSRELKQEIRDDQPPAEIKDEPGKYRVIYADPPWKYGDERGTVAAGGASAQYPLMSIDQLACMNVSELAASNAVLFLWVTVPLLAESMQVIEAWGFQYKTHIVWDKERPYYGNYSHVQHELLCICTRGSCVPDDGVDLPRSVIAIKKTDHSRKPHEFYELIESLYPSGSRIELFARNTRDGWKSWGNEITERS